MIFAVWQAPRASLEIDATTPQPSDAQCRESRRIKQQVPGLVSASQDPK
jgi:hypothetical protein